VERLARCDRSHVQALSSALLEDIGLGHRLLRWPRRWTCPSTFPAWGGPADATRAASAEAAGDDLPAPAAPPPTLTHVPRAERRGGDLLAVAIQDLSTALVGGGDALDGAAAMALEALWRGLDARAAMLYLRPAARRFLV